MNYTPNSLCPNCFKASRQKKCLSCHFDQNNYLEEAQHLPLFSIIGEQYTLGRVLDSEDLAITYIAQKKDEKERFVIKEYYPEHLAGRSRNSHSIKPKNSTEKKQGFDLYYKSFMDEARLLENCQKHPAILGVVRYADLIEQNNTLYLVMEYLQGCTLFDLWLNQQKLTEDQIRLWLQPMLETLEKLHQRKIYHRNISLKNIFLRGGAKKLDTPVLIDFSPLQHLTQSSLINVNSPKYQAPEQCIDNPEIEIDARTDLYALGAVLFHCLNGKKLPSIEIRRMGSALVFNDGNINPALKKAIERCLALSKKNRPENIAALKKLLAPFLSPPKEKPTFTLSTDEKRQRDLALWQQTKKADSINAYQSYLKHSYLGEQKEIAAEAIKRLKLEARLAILEKKKPSDPAEPVFKIIERFSLSKSEDRLNPGQLAPIMILIPAGDFLMGSAKTEMDRFENETQYAVEIKKPFYIGQYPITFAEYDLFCEQTNIKKPDDSGWGRENHPVTQ
ncbi:MAG: protein kinase, partial [Methylococcales bacterium]|nr:protein kinase [Methylococcales bacterium]